MSVASHAPAGGRLCRCTPKRLARRSLRDGQSGPMTGEREVLRNEALAVGCWVGVVAWIVLTPVFIATATDPSLGSSIAIGVLGLVMVTGSYRVSRMRIEMTDAGLAVHKLLGTERVAWQDVNEVSADYYGLHITRADGRVVTAGTMGRPRATRSGKEAKADRWVRRIKERAAAAHLPD